MAFLQPGPHGFQRGRREIEVPGCCEISDAALVSQIVKKGTIGGLRTCDLRQPGLDGREPGRIGETGLTMENGRVIGIAPVPGLGLVEQPGHRAPRRPAVIGGVEVGCQVFGVPAQPAIRFPAEKLNRRYCSPFDPAYRAFGLSGARGCASGRRARVGLVDGHDDSTSSSHSAGQSVCRVRADPPPPPAGGRDAPGRYPPAR